MLSIVFEALALYFTDNRMYRQDGSIVARHIVNWFRMGVWFWISLYSFVQERLVVTSGDFSRRVQGAAAVIGRGILR